METWETWGATERKVSKFRAGVWKMANALRRLVHSLVTF